jgi:hypothetical protein
MPRNKKDAALKCKPASRKKAKPTKQAETKTPDRTSAKSVGANRARGIELYKLAGRPTREEFQLVYGSRGHLLTWQERAKAGVPAEKFQAALASKKAVR